MAEIVGNVPLKNLEEYKPFIVITTDGFMVESEYFKTKKEGKMKVKRVARKYNMAIKPGGMSAVGHGIKTWLDIATKGDD